MATPKEISGSKSAKLNGTPLWAAREAAIGPCRSFGSLTITIYIQLVPRALLQIDWGNLISSVGKLNYLSKNLSESTSRLTLWVPVISSTICNEKNEIKLATHSAKLALMQTVFNAFISWNRMQFWASFAGYQFKMSKLTTMISREVFLIERINIKCYAITKQ